MRWKKAYTKNRVAQDHVNQERQTLLLLLMLETQVCANVPMCSVPMLEGSAINEQRSSSQCMCWMLCGVRCQYSLCEMGKSTGVIDTNLALRACQCGVFRRVG